MSTYIINKGDNGGGVIFFDHHGILLLRTERKKKIKTKKHNADKILTINIPILKDLTFASRIP